MSDTHVGYLRRETAQGADLWAVHLQGTHAVVVSTEGAGKRTPPVTLAEVEGPSVAELLTALAREVADVKHVHVTDLSGGFVGG